MTFKDKVKATIDEAQSADDLISIMRHYPLRSIRASLSELLKQITESQARSIHYESCSIEEIMPSDVMQSMLSFVPQQRQIKFVSKSFKKLTEQNEILRNRSREQRIASQFNGKNVWNVHKVEDGLTSQKNEEPSKFINGLDDVFAEMDDGDKVFLHEGAYILGEVGFGNKNIEIEGVGDCSLTTCSEEYDDDMDVSHIVSINNVRFENTRFNVERGGSMYLTDCEFCIWSGIGVNNRGSLNCHSCRFQGDLDSYSSVSAIGACSLTVENCLFNGGADPHDVGSFGCIVFPDRDNYGWKDSNLKIIGNTFINSNGCPPLGLVSETTPVTPVINSKAIFKNNLVCDKKKADKDILYAFVHIMEKD